MSSRWGINRTVGQMYALIYVPSRAPNTDEDRFAQGRMKSMHDLIELMTNWFEDVHRMDQKTLAQLMKMGSKVQRLL